MNHFIEIKMKEYKCIQKTKSTEEKKIPSKRLQLYNIESIEWSQKILKSYWKERQRAHTNLRGNPNTGRKPRLFVVIIF